MSGWMAPAVTRAVASCLLIGGVGVSAAAAQSVKDGYDRPAFFFNEIRLGAFAHQLGGSPSEHGVDVNVEALTPRIGAPRGDYLLDYFLRPRLHVGGTINTGGDTSLGYFGVTWDLKLTERLFFETSFGGAVHDGNLHREPGHTAYGCRMNFRESASLGYHLSERWDVLATIDHMSNGGICEENRGLTDAGLRFGYKF